VAPSPKSQDGQEQESRHLLEYWYVLVRRRRLAAGVFLLVVAVAAVRSLLTQPVYSATVQLLIERENPNVLTFKEVAELKAQMGDEYYQTQYKLLQSRTLARRVIEELNLLADPEFGGPRLPDVVEAARRSPPGESAVMEGVITAFLGRVKVQLVRNSRIVTVTINALRPELAAQAANKLAQLYIEQTLEFRYKTSAEAGHWLGEQIEEQRRLVEEAELALQRLKEREGIPNIEERRALLEQRLKELGTAFTKLRTERLEKEALARQMREARNPEELPEVLKNYVIQALRIELAKHETQLAQLEERYLDQHPEVIRVRNQIQESRQKLGAEAQRLIRAAENDYKAAAAQEASVAGALEAAKAEALELARRGVQYDSLKRELTANKDVLNGLMSRRKETDVAQELRASNIHIVDPAVVPRRPVRPQPLRDILVGVLFALVLSVSLSFFLEYLDNTLKTPEDVRTHLGTPLLSVIPEQQGSEGRPRVLSDGLKQGPFVEGFRLLRTALNYSWPERRTRVVAVTSTAPSEGKTLTSVNLALMLASGEGKVLLIDADLRKSQVHSMLRGKRTPGLTDLLVGQRKPSEAIQRVPGTTLSVLAAGSHVPSPGDLLTADSFKGLLEGVRDFYDWVIIDTPPVAVVADALVIATMVDGVIVVAGAEMVPRKSVQHTLERVAATGARVVGAVLNRAQAERFSYYYGRYYGHYYYGDYHKAYQQGPAPKESQGSASRLAR
jgi:capsular exopolysaccharide synthesis family protein